MSDKVSVAAISQLRAGLISSTIYETGTEDRELDMEIAELLDDRGTFQREVPNSCDYYTGYFEHTISLVKTLLPREAIVSVNAPLGSMGVGIMDTTMPVAVTVSVEVRDQFFTASSINASMALLDCAFQYLIGESS